MRTRGPGWILLASCMGLLACGRSGLPVTQGPSATQAPDAGQGPAGSPSGSAAHGPEAGQLGTPGVRPGAGARPLDDVDADGVRDGQDNCPDHPNPDQADQAHNGRGDACHFRSVDTGQYATCAIKEDDTLW